MTIWRFQSRYVAGPALVLKRQATIFLREKSNRRSSRELEESSYPPELNTFLSMLPLIKEWAIHGPSTVKA